MASARDHLHLQGERPPSAAVHRAADPAPALAGRDDPRLARRGAEAGLMHLQGIAGNAAVSSLVAPAVQRAVEINELTTNVDVSDAPPATGTASASGPVTSDGAVTTVSGSEIRLDAPMTSTDGIIRAGTIIADNVIGSNYTPGAGNLF